MLYAEVERVFESARTISRAARDIRELRTGRLEVCVLPAFGHTLLPKLIAGFTALHPSVTIGLDVRSSVTVIQRASRNQLDIGIAATLAEDNPSVSRRKLASTPPVSVMPAGHPLSTLPVVKATDLDGEDFISLGTTDPTRRKLDFLCDEQRVNRAMKIEASLSTTCIDLVAEGAGVAVVDRLSAWMARDRPIEIREFEPELELELSIYRPWGVAASSVADAFIDYMIQQTRSFMQTVNDGIRTLTVSKT
jgi:DNA-binding transcriptional LysR family regulator